MKNKTLLWTIIGGFVLVFGGSLLHFTYQWSGYNPFVGLFSSVNESVWEHMKLGFGSLLIFSLFEYWFIRKDARNYFIAKAAGLFSLQLFIILFFYTYTLFTEEILLLDIISYVIGCIICQIIIYKIYKRKQMPGWISALSILLLALHAATLMYFTFNTPKLPIFEEDHSGRYGTEWDYKGEEDHDH